MIQKEALLLQMLRFDLILEVHQSSPTFIPAVHGKPRVLSQGLVSYFLFQHLSLPHLEDKEIKEEIANMNASNSFSGHTIYLNINPTFMGCF